MAQVTYAVRK